MSRLTVGKSPPFSSRNRLMDRGMLIDRGARYDEDGMCEVQRMWGERSSSGSSGHGGGRACRRAAAVVVQRSGLSR